MQVTSGRRGEADACFHGPDFNQRGTQMNTDKKPVPNLSSVLILNNRSQRPMKTQRLCSDLRFGLAASVGLGLALMTAAASPPFSYTNNGHGLVITR